MSRSTLWFVLLAFGVGCSGGGTSTVSTPTDATPQADQPTTPAPPVTAGSPETSANPAPAPKQPKSNSAPTQAESPDTAVAASTSDKFDTRFFAKSFVGAVVVRPQLLCESAIGKAVLKQEAIAAGIQETSIQPANLVRLMLLLRAPGEGSVEPPEPGTVFTFAGPVDRDAVLNEVLGEDAADATHAGKAYRKGEFDSAMFVDDKTLILGPDDVVQQMLEANGEATPLSKRLGELNLDQGVAGVIMLSSMKPALESASSLAPMAPTMLAPLAEVAPHLEELEIGFDLSQGDLLKLGFRCDDEASAKQLGDLATGLVQMAKLFYPQAKAQLEEGDATPAELLGALDKLVGSLAASKNGASVTVKTGRPENLDEIAEPLVAQLIQLVDPPDDWKQRDFPEQQFAIKLPQPSKPSAIEIPDLENLPKQWNLFCFSNENSDLMLQIEIREVTPDQAKLSPAELLKEELGFREAKEPKQREIDGFPAVEYQSMIEFDDIKRFERHLLVVTKTMIYDVMSSGPNEETTNQPDYFSSFKLIKPQPE
ncbi:MAG: hypothetical protein KDB14_17415 [Planctomycetales bacterium]|nr:hypothetical protein [Planctomycetales bacterium]